MMLMICLITLRAIKTTTYLVNSTPKYAENSINPIIIKITPTTHTHTRSAVISELVSLVD
jgi:hypothetical protein